MKRALPLVASFFSSCTGGHRPPSMPAADRSYPGTSGVEPLPSSWVQIGIAPWDSSALRPTVSGNVADFDHATTAPRPVPLRTHAMGTPVVPEHAVRVRSNARGPYTRHRILDLSSEAARQCAMVRADVAQVQVALRAAALLLAQFLARLGELLPEPWHTTPLFQPPGLQPVAVQARASQDQGSTQRVQGEQDSRIPGLVEVVLLRTCVIPGVQNRRQTSSRVRHDSPTGGAKIGA